MRIGDLAATLFECVASKARQLHRERDQERNQSYLRLTSEADS